MTEPVEGEPDALADLVERFTAALLVKLRASSNREGRGDAWKRDDWRAGLSVEMAKHVEKGDPLDVAAYAAFAWHHGWSVCSSPPAWWLNAALDGLPEPVREQVRVQRQRRWDRRMSMTDRALVLLAPVDPRDDLELTHGNW